MASRALFAAVLAAVGLIAALMPSDAYAAETVIGFDDLPPGTVVERQYAAKGVTFGRPGLLPVVAAAPAGQAQSGNQVANISTCVGCEFYSPEVRGTFTAPTQRVRLSVGEFGPGLDTAELTLRAYDAAGRLVAQSSPATVTAGGGFRTKLAVASATPNIASFTVSARQSLDDNKQLGIDELVFGGSPPQPPQPPAPPAEPAPAPSLAPPRVVERPSLAAVPRRGAWLQPSSLRVSSRRGPAALTFDLSAAARVVFVVRRAHAGRVLGTFAVKASAGTNRVVLPRWVRAAIVRRLTTITLRSQSQDQGSVTIGPPTGTRFAGTVWRTTFKSKIVSIAGYYSADDGSQHVIVATENGDVTEAFFRPRDPQLRPGQTLLGQIRLVHFAAPIVGVAGYYAPGDGYQHVLVATKAGTISEFYFKPFSVDRVLHQDAPAYVPGITDLAGFAAPDGNQHLIAVTREGEVRDFYFKSPFDNVYERRLGNLADLAFTGAYAAVDVAAWYSDYRQALSVLVADNTGALHRFFYYPRDDTVRHYVQRDAGVSGVAGYYDAASRYDHGLSISSGVVRDDYEGSAENCRGSSGFCVNGISSGSVTRRDAGSPHFASPITSIAAYFAPGDVASIGGYLRYYNHLIVATADGNVTDTFFYDPWRAAIIEGGT